MDSEEHIDTEQEILDKDIDDVMTFRSDCKHYTSPASEEAVTPTRSFPDHIIVEHRLTQLQARLVAVRVDVAKLTTKPRDVHLVHLYQVQLTDLHSSVQY